MIRRDKVDLQRGLVNEIGRQLSLDRRSEALEVTHLLTKLPLLLTSWPSALT